MDPLKKTFILRHLVPLRTIKDIHKSVLNHHRQGMKPNKSVAWILEHSTTWPAAQKLFDSRYLAYFLEWRVMEHKETPEQIGSLPISLGETHQDVNLEEILDEAKKLKENAS